MKIQIQNLGTIEEGTIDLSKELIIFAGQNNTGKSYVSYLIYGLYKLKLPDLNLKSITQIFASKYIKPAITITKEPKPVYPPIWFFPAERTAINMLAKEVFREKASELDYISQEILTEDNLEAIVKSIKQKGLVPRYPLAIRDYLYFINDLDYIARNESSFANFANEIETMLLQGKISISNYGDIKFTPKNSQQVLDIHISSSLVKSLSSLVVYFRHVAQQGDIIIMDEPELNLHPDSQRIIARILTKAINKGFKIILSTHSDYIIKEINNMIMLNKASEIEKQELFEIYGYDQEQVLDQKKVGAYFFSNHTIEPIEVSDTGLTVKTIDATIDALDNTMENLYYKLFEQT